MPGENDGKPNLTDGGGGSGDGGGGDFRALIPEAFRAHPTLAPYKTMEDLVKSHISVNEMIGKNKIAVPDEKADDKAWAEFWTKLGRPESPDKYGLKKPENFPEGLNIPDKYLQTLSTAFHKFGLTPKQAQGIFGELNQFAASSFQEDVKQTQGEYDQAMNALRTEFGAAFDEKVDVAKRAVAALLDKTAQEFLNENGLNTHPQMVRIFAAIGEKLKEDISDGGGGGGGGFKGMNAQQAQAEIQTLQADADFMRQYMTQNDPGHKAAVERMLKLMEVAYPGQQRE